MKMPAIPVARIIMFAVGCAVMYGTNRYITHIDLANSSQVIITVEAFVFGYLFRKHGG